MGMKPDPLTNYVLHWYQRFITAEEKRLLLGLGLLVKDENCTSSAEHREAEKRGAPAPVWKDIGEFRDFVAARILRENANDVVINRCPKCAALTASPSAKQCLSCGNDWH